MGSSDFPMSLMICENFPLFHYIRSGFRWGLPAYAETNSGNPRRVPLPPKRRPFPKAAILGIVFTAVVLALIFYLTMHLEQYECEVCMEFEGRTKCLTVQGESEQQTVQTAKDNACSYITNGRAEGIRCSQTPPASTQCKHL